MREWTRGDVARLLPKLREMSEGSCEGYAAARKKLAAQIGPKIAAEVRKDAEALPGWRSDEGDDSRASLMRDFVGYEPRANDEFLLEYVPAGTGWVMVINRSGRFASLVVPYVGQYLERIVEVADAEIRDALEVIEFHDGLLEGILNDIARAQIAQARAKDLGLPDLFGFSPYLKHAYEDEK